MSSDADPTFSHMDEQGRSRMVDVGHKPEQVRVAVAEGQIDIAPSVVAALKHTKKGNAYEVARIAGIMAAKKTPELIPLCHTLLLNSVVIDFESDPEEGWVKATASVRCNGKTGVEMEALTAVSTALLTLYDMAKAADKNMVIRHIKLISKTKSTDSTERRKSG